MSPAADAPPAPDLQSAGLVQPRGAIGRADRAGRGAHRRRLLLGVGEGQTGLLQTALTLPFMLFAIPAGLLADRISRRWLMADPKPCAPRRCWRPSP